MYGGSSIIWLLTCDANCFSHGFINYWLEVKKKKISSELSPLSFVPKKTFSCKTANKKLRFQENIVEKYFYFAFIFRPAFFSVIINCPKEEKSDINKQKEVSVIFYLFLIDEFICSKRNKTKESTKVKFIIINNRLQNWC